MIEQSTETRQTAAEPVRVPDVAPAPEAVQRAAAPVPEAISAARGTSFTAPPLNPKVRRSDVVQRAGDNTTGMPDNLKSGLESLSGMDMSDVKVHYNSPKPASIQAHAYAQGNEVHLGPGQEQHLPHEAWHVVQQRQGRVSPTTAVNGAPINDNPSLEAEATEMGNKALNS